jgi:cation diffusion facilitator family transporter
MHKREQLIVRASWISIIGNAVLSVLKIVIGLISGSLAVVGDGIDSASDIVASIITLITAHVISRPPNTRYPYGYEKADTIASKALSFVIFFAGAQLAISTISRLVEGIERAMPDTLAIYVTIVSILGKYGLAWYQKKIGKSTKSSMLIANARNMQNDVIISLTVLVGLVFTFVFELPIVDTITGLAVSVYIMFVAYKIFMQTNLELMDGVEDPTIYTKIFKAVAKIKGVHNPHNCKVRKMGHQYLIAIDIEVDGSLTVTNSHQLAHQVDYQIRQDIENVYDILVHIEPYGQKSKDASYGVSNKDLDNA